MSPLFTRPSFALAPSGGASPRTGAGRAKRQRGGFTLVEAMMSTFMFTMLALGVYATLIKSYQIIALCRCRDEARAVLRTYADQFQRLQTTKKVDRADDPLTTGDDSYHGTATRWIFFPTGGPSGRGLRWGALSDTDTSVAAPIPDPDYLSITLGTGSHATAATLTRNVRYVNAATGADSTAQQIDAAGYMLAATFEIRYQLVGKSYSQSVTVVRAAP